MRIKGIAISLAAAAVVSGIAAIVITLSAGDSEFVQEQLIVDNASKVSSQTQPPAMQQPEEKVNVVAEISGTNDGKELSVSMGAEGDTSFAIMNKEQGDVVTIKVESEQANKLEVGIMSVSSDQVYSEVIPDGTGEIKITVPSDGEYRMYIKNHSSKEARFLLILDEPLTGPLV